MTAADTAGLVTFAKADKDNLLYLIKTQLRAERFMKGKLKVTSPVRWELFINGESKMGRMLRKTASLKQQPKRSLYVSNPKWIMK